MSTSNRPLTTYVLLTVVVVIWASSPALIEVALADMPPFTLAALRCTIASTMLVALLWRGRVEGEQPVTRADLGPLLVLGLAGITLSVGIHYLGRARSGDPASGRERGGCPGRGRDGDPGGRLDDDAAVTAC